MPNRNTNINIFVFMAFIFYSQSFARFLFVFIFLAEGDSLKFLLITASKIAKSFQTFPDISTGIGRWYQSDHKYSGLSAATTGYNQTTIDQGTFHGQNCQNDGKIRPGVPKKESAKRFYSSGTFLKKQINLFQIFIAYCLYIFHILYRAICFAWIKF